jgi:hypothetical protein
VIGSEETGICFFPVSCPPAPEVKTCSCLFLFSRLMLYMINRQLVEVGVKTRGLDIFVDRQFDSHPLSGIVGKKALRLMERRESGSASSTSTERTPISNAIEKLRPSPNTQALPRPGKKKLEIYHGIYPQWDQDPVHLMCVITWDLKCPLLLLVKIANFTILDIHHPRTRTSL